MILNAASRPWKGMRANTNDAGQATASSKTTVMTTTIRLFASDCQKTLWLRIEVKFSQCQTVGRENGALLSSSVDLKPPRKAVRIGISIKMATTVHMI